MTIYLEIELYLFDPVEIEIFSIDGKRRPHSATSLLNSLSYSSMFPLIKIEKK